MGDDPTEHQDFTYGDSHPVNPTKGGIGLSYGGPKGGPATLGLGWSYDGEDWQPVTPDLSYGAAGVSVNAETDQYGYSSPTSPSFGYVVKMDGVYGTATLGWKGWGLTAEVHEDNPTTNMEAAAQSYEVRDKNGKVIGLDHYVPVGNATQGWSWKVTRVDLRGNLIAEPRILPMDEQTQKQMSSGFVNNHCFIAETPIQMWPTDPSLKPRDDGSYDEELVLSKVWDKPISEIRTGDLVVAYDDRGRLAPKSVTRTMTNTAKHVLDFWGTGVTPGHAYFCADGKFKGQHVPLLDILRTDGTIMNSDGTQIRAATGCDVGSIHDRLVHVVVGDKKPNGQIAIREQGQIRLGTRIYLENGEQHCVLDILNANGAQITEDGYIRPGAGGAKVPLSWTFSEQLPKPEDYILERSKVTLEEIYAAGEWEQIGPRLPAPDSSEASPQRRNAMPDYPREQLGRPEGVHG
ncbi:hypothetical protein [Ruegeria sp. Ofav3-42]|uniref:hypothetical protein n=1 Tax=Ruegeria sp. Ofav3-42 TaxID=2917759 RepID=UPI001EF4DB54|nr:hypothetical protein [Ruegeria sp. Ofav3-42]MCG7522234.1 hypothetical protein [Ruegeria sp. Ofav3-42]